MESAFASHNRNHWFNAVAGNIITEDLFIYADDYNTEYWNGKTTRLPAIQIQMYSSSNHIICTYTYMEYCEEVTVNVT